MHNYYAFMTMYTEDWSTYPQWFLHVYIQYTYCILFINSRNIPMKRDWRTFLVSRSHAPAIPCFCVPRSLHFRYAGTRERKFVTGTWIVKNANANFVLLWRNATTGPPWGQEGGRRGRGLGQSSSSSPKQNPPPPAPCLSLWISRGPKWRTKSWSEWEVYMRIRSWYAYWACCILGFIAYRVNCILG